MEKEIQEAAISLREIYGESLIENIKNIEALVLWQPKKKMVTLSVVRDNNIIPIMECHDIEMSSFCPYDFVEGLIKRAYPDDKIPPIKVKLIFS